MVQKISKLRREIASLCEALGVERLYLFGFVAQESTLAEVRDLDVESKVSPLSISALSSNST